MRLALVLALASLLSPFAVAEHEDGYVLEILSLRYRSAADLLPDVLPMVQGAGAVVGNGNQLLVRSTPERIQQVRDVVRALDVEPRNLWISVRQVFGRRRGHSEGGPEIAILNGDVDVRGTWSTGSFSGFEGAVQSVRALEGTEATVEIRRDVPVHGRQLAILREGVAVVDDWYFAALGSGFAVVPRLYGDKVALDVVTRHSVPNGSAGRNEQELRTSLSSALGRWIEVGHVLEDHARRRSTLLGIAAGDERTEHSVLVKVDRIDER